MFSHRIKKQVWVNYSFEELLVLHFSDLKLRLADTLLIKLVDQLWKNPGRIYYSLLRGDSVRLRRLFN